MASVFNWYPFPLLTSFLPLVYYSTCFLSFSLTSLWPFLRLLVTVNCLNYFFTSITLNLLTHSWAAATLDVKWFYSCKINALKPVKSHKNYRSNWILSIQIQLVFFTISSLLSKYCLGTDQKEAFEIFKKWLLSVVFHLILFFSSFHKVFLISKFSTCC